jgi:hypothetical protein
VGARRASWRVLNQAEGLVKDKMESEVLQRYMRKVEKELQDLCGEVLTLLTDVLIKQCPEENHEEHVFYLKMAGDYYRCVVCGRRRTPPVRTCISPVQPRCLAADVNR